MTEPRQPTTGIVVGSKANGVPRLLPLDALDGYRAQIPWLEGALPTGMSPLELDGNLVGWAVHLGRRGVRFQRDFRASSHGGLQAAFRVARDYLDKVDREYPRLSSTERCTIRRADNTSGVPGVGRQQIEGKPYWVASVHARGFKKARRFSVAKYGDERARTLAIEARRVLLEQLQLWLARTDEQRAHVPARAERLELARPATGGFTRANPHVQRASGVLGVRLKRNESRRKDGTVTLAEYWLASMKVGELHYRAYFSIKRYGHDEALRRAIAQRKAWERTFREPKR